MKLGSAVSRAIVRSASAKPFRSARRSAFANPRNEGRGRLAEPTAPGRRPALQALNVRCSMFGVRCSLLLSQRQQAGALQRLRQRVGAPSSTPAFGVRRLVGGFTPKASPAGNGSPSRPSGRPSRMSPPGAPDFCPAPGTTKTKQFGPDRRSALTSGLRGSDWPARRVDCPFHPWPFVAAASNRTCRGCRSAKPKREM